MIRFISSVSKDTQETGVRASASVPAPCGLDSSLTTKLRQAGAMITNLATACLLFGAVAHAAPPPVGSEDYLIMKDFADWVRTQHAPDGRWCCDISDGRPVAARPSPDGTQWQVWISDKQFRDAPNAWVNVPDDRIIRGANPVGVPIAWYIGGSVLCFAPASAS